MAVLSYIHRNGLKRPMCWLAAGFVIIICIFLSARSWEKAVSHMDTGQALIEGIITSKEYKDGGYGAYWQLTIKDIFCYNETGQEAGKAANNKKYLEGKYICQMKEEGEFFIGQKIVMTGKYSPFEKISNPGQFDMGKWYCSQGILGQFKGCEAKKLSVSYSKFGEGLWKIRKKATESLIKEMGEKDGNLISAMILGEKSGIIEESKNLYRRNGISHILSISGLHLMLLGMAFFTFLRRILPNEKFAAVGSILIMSVYCIFTGGSISTVRATIMFTLMLIAKILGRSYDSLSGLAVAAVVQLFLNPYALQNSGFLLSFLAVLGVTFVTGRLQEIFDPKQKIIKSLLVSVGSSLTTLPIVLRDYNAYPWYGIFLNLLIIPPMSLLLGSSIGAAVLSVLLSEFSLTNDNIFSIFISETFLHDIMIFLKNIFIFIDKIILKYFEYCCYVFEKMPLQDGFMASPSHGQITIYYLILILVLYNKPLSFDTCPEGRTNGHSYYNTNIPTNFLKIILLLFSIVFLTSQYTSGCEITMLDVGQGDCIVIKSGEGRVYISDGGSSSVNKAGQYRILPFLKNKGYDMIEGIFISHPDEDHMNGIVELLTMAKEEHLTIKNLFLSVSIRKMKGAKEKLDQLEKLAKNNNIRIIYLTSGNSVTDGKLKITCLYPGENTYISDSNEGSLVLDLTYGDFNMLLTGDVGEKAEKELITYKKKDDMGMKGTDVEMKQKHMEATEDSAGIRKNRLQQYEVLKVAHHGSSTSSCYDFLQIIKPSVSLISCGKDNVYGHPSKEVVERLEDIGSRIFDTRISGAIIIRPETDGSFEMESFHK